jgi:hypothetical protein
MAARIPENKVQKILESGLLTGPPAAAPRAVQDIGGRNSHKKDTTPSVGHRDLRIK